MDYRIARKEDYNKASVLWQKTFGDTSDTVNYFLEHFASGNLLVCDNDAEIVSMMLLFESEIVIKSHNYKAFYIYAAATDEKYRKKGIMSNLLEYAGEIAKSRNAYFLFLKPASEYLYSFYRNNGFENAFFQNHETLYNSAVKYQYDYVKWNDDVIKADKIFSDNTAFQTLNGYASLNISEDRITVKRFVSKDVFALIEDIKNTFYDKKIYVGLPANQTDGNFEKTGMIKCLSDIKPDSKIYLGITLE